MLCSRPFEIPEVLSNLEFHEGDYRSSPVGSPIAVLRVRVSRALFSIVNLGVAGEAKSDEIVLCGRSQVATEFDVMDLEIR